MAIDISVTNGQDVKKFRDVSATELLLQVTMLFGVGTVEGPDGYIVTAAHPTLTEGLYTWTAAAGAQGVGGGATGSKKRSRVEAESREAGEEGIKATFERFTLAMSAPEKAPTNLSELEAMLASHQGGLIPVTQDMYDSWMLVEKRDSFLFPGRGPVAHYMTAALEALAEVETAGQTEQATATSVSSWLFKNLNDMLQHNMMGALKLKILLNASAAKDTLSCPIQGLDRPDVVAMSKRNVSLLVVEENKFGEMAAAAADLASYLDGGLPVEYQKIQAIPVAGVAGCDIKFGLCDVDGNVSLMADPITVGTRPGALQALVATLNVFRLMRLLNDQAPKELAEMGLGGVLERPQGCSIYFGSRNQGITKIIDDFNKYKTNFGASFKAIEAAYQVKSPFLPEIRQGPSLTGRKPKYTVQVMTRGTKLVMLKGLREEKAACCVYAWLSVAGKLHAKGICAADFRWQNMMEQQKRALPANAAHNPEYEALESIPLIIDMELARECDLEPRVMLESWEEGTLQPHTRGTETIHVYKVSSDVYQIGVMLKRWQDVHPACSPGVAVCVAALKSHARTAADIAQNDPWLAGARKAFAGLV